MVQDPARSTLERLRSERAERLREMELGAVANQRRLADLLRALGAPCARSGRDR